MQPNHSRRWQLGVLAAACAVLAAPALAAGVQDPVFDPLFDAPRCAPQPAAMSTSFLRQVAATRTETAPFQPAPLGASEGQVPLYLDQGTLAFKIATRQPRAQAHFDPGLRLAFGFNPAPAQCAYRRAWFGPVEGPALRQL